MNKRSDKTGRNTLIIAVLLVLLMVTTRPHPIGAITHLPDASLAIFFGGGFYLSRYLLFTLYLLLAVLLDFFSITINGVNSFCVSPAYWFLIPTYAFVWYAGRFYQGYYRLSWHSIWLLSITAFVSISAAFIISNGSFYLVSGYYIDKSLEEYLTGFGMYYPYYVNSAFAYIASLVCIHFIIVHINNIPRDKNTEYKKT